jgi:hypothetical protein
MQDTETVSKMGLPKLRFLRKNPLAGSALPRANRMRDKATQRMASNWRYLRPHQGDLTCSSFVSKSWLGSFHHAPLSRLAPSYVGSPDRDDPKMMHETTRPRLARGRGGHQPLSTPMVRYICPCWLSPANGDLGSTQILTEHRGAGL